MYWGKKMNNIKSISILSITFLLVILLIPALIVIPSSKKNQTIPESSNTQKSDIHTTDIEIAVYKNQSQTIENVPIEEYIVGVVASEMPANYELEALKAQAIVARTYLTRRLISEKNPNLPDGTVITDGVNDQVFKSETQLKEEWGENYKLRIEKIKRAVKETEGIIITYDNQPIDATYFAISNGFTEDSEKYWENEIPYLRSVYSPWDLSSPQYRENQVFTIKDFEQKLGVKITDENIGEILSYTPGHRVEKVRFGNKEFTGKEVRDALQLRSSDFTWERKGNEIVVTTEGYGHGVGMSQYGANAMAKEGKSCIDIIEHYYKDIELSNIESFLDKTTVKK